MVLHLRWTNFHTAKANPAAATARPPIMRVSAENRVDTVMPVNARAKPTKISKIPWRDFSGPDSRLLKLATITRIAIETTARKRNRGAIILLRCSNYAACRWLGPIILEERSADRATLFLTIKPQKWSQSSRICIVTRKR